MYQRQKKGPCWNCKISLVHTEYQMSCMSSHLFLIFLLPGTCKFSTIRQFSQARHEPSSFSVWQLLGPSFICMEHQLKELHPAHHLLVERQPVRGCKIYWLEKDKGNSEIVPLYRMKQHTPRATVSQIPRVLRREVVLWMIPGAESERLHQYENPCDILMDIFLKTFIEV